MPRRGDSESFRLRRAERAERYRCGVQVTVGRVLVNLRDPKDALTSKLLKTVRQQDSIEKAWRVIQDNARGSTSTLVRQEIDDFADESGKRIRSICHRLSRNQFEFGKARGIPIFKTDAAGRNTGKIRPIVLASVEARIVQRSVLEVLQSISALSGYINTPHSFGGLRKEKTVDGENKRDKPTAVPAAIKAVLDAIDAGAQYYACADIKSFFTRISKLQVTDIIGTAVNDPEFLAFFSKAITVELANMAELREKVSEFPIEEIGVAQGNSLSPLLGNIALAAFDQEMNNGDCRCIRYIDDFIILAPSKRAADAKLRKATVHLARLGMELSSDKSSVGGVAIKDGMAFLGVEIMPGIIRPAAKAQQKFLQTVSDEFERTRKAFVEVQHGKTLSRRLTLISTLKRVEGIVDGWGKHYWFCNDLQLFAQIDTRIQASLRNFLGAYQNIRSKIPQDRRHLLLGLPMLIDQKRQPYKYPKLSSN